MLQFDSAGHTAPMPGHPPAGNVGAELTGGGLCVCRLPFPGIDPGAQV
jgi:hypothetical protein